MKPLRRWAITYLVGDKPPAKTATVEARSLPNALERFASDFHWQVTWPNEIDVLSVTLQPEK